MELGGLGAGDCKSEATTAAWINYQQKQGMTTLIQTNMTVHICTYKHVGAYTQTFVLVHYIHAIIHAIRM